ncbi:MAG: Hsp70 family protein, partial [Pirellulales bacterium]|nr:Hsp70 family protein [Pirellulales bacterium]
TADDNQTAVTVRVFQGEREMCADNRLLGQFNLEGIPPAPRGVPQIEVRFDLDANGILNVAAKDLGTGKEQTVKIEQSSGLSEDEIDRMQKDAAAHADEDKKKRELVEARNEAESRSYQLEKLMKEQGESLSDTDKTALEAAIAKVREAAKGEDAAAIKGAIAELEQASHAMSEALYKAAGAAGEPAAAGGESPEPSESDSSDDDAIDAEFEVKS